MKNEKENLNTLKMGGDEGGKWVWKFVNFKVRKIKLHAKQNDMTHSIQLNFTTTQQQ